MPFTSRRKEQFHYVDLWSTPTVNANVLNLRNQWYDRNPNIKSTVWWSLEQEPHTRINWLVYTVPSGKKAIVGGALMQIIRRAAPTSLGPVIAMLDLENSGICHEYTLFHYSSTVGSTQLTGFTINAVLNAGDMLVIGTEDQSAGGFMIYSICPMTTEFDA